MSGLVDHVMIRVEDLDRSLDWYTTHLEYEEKGRWEADTFTNVYLGPADMHDAGAMFELTYNHDDRSYEMGDAWGHVSVRVPDSYAAYDRLVDAGAEGYLGPDDTQGRFTFVKDPDGHEIELSERDYGAFGSLDHIMLRSGDPTRDVGWYVRMLEYDCYWRAERDAWQLYNLRPADAPRDAAAVQVAYEYDGPFTMGDAWGHLAVRVDDLHEAWDALLFRGAADYRDPDSCDDRYAFTKDPGGHEIELLARE